MRRNATLAAAIAALCLASTAGAQNYLGYKVPFADKHKYWIDGRNNVPAGLSLTGDVVPATQNAWNAWDGVSCAYVGFAYQGLVTTPDATDTTDARSVSTLWVASSSDPYYNYALASGAAVAAAVPLTYAGALYSCDIFLNAFDYAWSTQSPTPAGAFDLQTVLMREVGHCLGLGDSYNTYTDVMFAKLDPGIQKRSLQTNDINQLCSYYPVGGYGMPCPGGDTECTGQNLKCIKPPLPDGGTGSPYCSLGCALPPPGGANTCPIPYVCKASTLIPGYSGACLPSNDSETAVGKACTNNSQCGSVNGLCIQPGQFPSGYPLWANGYCTQDCTPGGGKPPCPTGSACYDITGTGTWRCLKTCPPGSSECRPDYACSPLAGLGQNVGACVPACHADVDCGPNQYCRTCDGVCLFRQTATNQIGDPCTKTEECGVGQACVKFSWSTTGVCTQPCTTGCAACPQGSSCQQAGPNGEAVCLRDCQDGTCSADQQCGYTKTGRGCMPACTADAQCPNGYRCASGQCVNINAQDGGSCVLCFKAGGDAGLPTGPADAGVGDPKPGGCGCQGTGGSAAFLLSILIALTLAGARRRWPTR